MTCFRIPTSIEDADLLIQACSGVADWRPAFVLGVQALGVVFAIALVVGFVGWMARRG